MSDAYVTGKIQEALKATSGDKKDAAKLLLTWAVRDQALLLGLTKPNLKDVIAERIEETSKSLKKKSSGESSSAKPRESAIVFPQGRGEKRTASKVPPPKSSERQASVMHQLVAAFKAKK